MLKKQKYKDFDWALLGAAAAIFIAGLLFLFSAVYSKNIDFIVRQISWFLIGALFFIGIINVNYRKIISLGYVFYFFSIILLLLVIFFGSKRLGAQRWLELGYFNLQPSEFAKLFITLALIQYLTEHKAEKGIRNIAAAFFVMALPFVLILAQPDLGTALMLVPVFFTLLYIWGAKLRHLFFMIVSGLLASPLAWFLLKDYQKDRLMVFINPNIDPLGAGYTVIQSMIAIGSGGVFGKGWLSGTQNQLNFLTERHTDFIFSVAGEEWGFAGGVILIILYYALVRRAIEIARKTDDPCGVLVACGMAAIIGIQAVVNISMTMGFMPVVGLPLPLVSYGGSSLLVTMIALGLLESVAIHR
ncbi:MAG: rod shape-determining protein RodA [Candidatus Omnitrophica bacterium CG_4_9_14_0_2_um_filter_42_8]|nr:MAG: rod shape-determining protein RodA [Candidatus Omnitrophica bacterium CG22_combo_CG10-13_8_21_14_all_43_16]PJC49093.1 MAG: rod shape-determining protein RodA [Candidatus Omnitrophica bacterium CG_4_9_14_0_2_um_filter_42_8]